MRGRILNIMRYSIHNGPGIRTTVFMKGCPLLCKWCHNPEALSSQVEMIYRKERCIHCGNCAAACPQQAVFTLDNGVITEWDKCIRCGSCIETRYAEARELIGREMTVEELGAMMIGVEAIIALANRYADKANELSLAEIDPQRKKELLEIASNCRRVPANAPETLHEALQYYWFVHLGVVTELNPWDAFNPGRLDQHVYPIYRKEIDEGKLTREKAKELLQCFWIKFNNQPAPPKVGVTEAESSTYTDFANINTGGLRADGNDGVNEMTYLILEVIDEMRLVQPSSNIQLSRKNPDEFLKHACEIIRKGWGQPSVFNADTIIEELLRQGKSIEDARNGGTSGCVETGAFGKESYILTGYFNLPKILEITLHNGTDPRTGRKIGLVIFHIGRKHLVPVHSAGKSDAAKRSGQSSALSSHQDWQRVLTLITLFVIVIFFWIAFYQNGFALTLFAQRSTRIYRYLQSETYQFFGPLFILLLTPIVVTIFMKMRAKGKEPTSAVKIFSGIFISGFSLLIMAGASIAGGNSDQNIMSPAWLISSYLVVTIAEILVSPMGLSFVSKVAPWKIRGLMMGCWFGATAIGSYGSGLLGRFYSSLTHHNYFLIVSSLLFFSSMLVLLFMKRLNKFTI